MHIDTRAQVNGYLAEHSGLKNALAGADVIVVTAGIARKPGMTRDGKSLRKTINTPDISQLITEYRLIQSMSYIEHTLQYVHRKTSTNLNVD